MEDNFYLPEHILSYVQKFHGYNLRFSQEIWNKNIEILNYYYQMNKEWTENEFRMISLTTLIDVIKIIGYYSMNKYEFKDTIIIYKIENIKMDEFWNEINDSIRVLFDTIK